MKKLESALIEELSLDGWEIEQLKPAIYQTLLSIHADHFENIEIRPNRYEGLAQRIWIDTFSKDEKDKDINGHSYFLKSLGYAVPLVMLEHWQAGPQLRIKVYCYYEEARPLYKHILSELSSEQQVVNDQQPDATTKERKYTLFEELALGDLLNIEPSKPTLNPTVEALIMNIYDDDDDSQAAENRKRVRGPNDGTLHKVYDALEIAIENNRGWIVAMDTAETSTRTVKRWALTVIDNLDDLDRAERWRTWLRANKNWTI